MVDSSSDSDSPDSDDSDDVESLDTARLELRMGATGERWNDELGERNGECSSESVREGGRSKIGDDVGDPAVLRRAAISRKAATEMRWEVSEAVLPLRGRGRTGGSRGVDSEESAEGDSGRMCRNDLRLNE